ncbi:MAG: DegV family protein [Clostridia bacterium]|nr:DegV family protein [Clostridia bacterium]
MNYKIVADSSADLVTFDGVDFASAPLKIITSEKEYVDDANLDVDKMVDELDKYNGKSSTACPSPADWMNGFGDADRVFCVSITGGLSGSYNAACVAKRDYEEKYPDRRVFVIDSLSAGPELRLIIEKLREYILDGKAFEEICKAITEYQKHTSLIFVLESMKNLARNGRVNPIVAKAAGLLGIRVVGKASDVGQLEPMEKCRGERNALASVVKIMKNLGTNIGKVHIGHCLNEGAAQKLKDMIVTEFENAKVEIYRIRGLCSFYAEKGGLMIGFER